MELKVGDKVKVIGGYGGAFSGRFGVVTELSERWCMVTTRKGLPDHTGDIDRPDDDFHLCFLESEVSGPIRHTTGTLTDLSILDYTPINVEKPIYEIEPDTRPLEHFQSGPVITETVKRIVPGVYGRIAIGRNNYGLVEAGIVDINGEYDLAELSRAELIAARDVFNQLTDAIDGE